MAGRRFVKGAIPVLLHPDRLAAPLRWQKPRRVFVCSLADLFHEDVPFGFVDRIWETMRVARQHTFQVLTKRPERMQLYLRDWAPLPNVWLGVSVENQRATWRIEELLRCPAVVHFISGEPLLGALDLRKWLQPMKGWGDLSQRSPYPLSPLIGLDRPPLSWVIVGGESGAMSTRGGPERALVERCVCLDGQRSWGREECTFCDRTGWRPKSSAIRWVRSLRDQCVAAGTAFHFKQWPMPPNKPGGPALIDGKEWRQMPDGGRLA